MFNVAKRFSGAFRSTKPSGSGSSDVVDPVVPSDSSSKGIFRRRTVNDRGNKSAFLQRTPRSNAENGSFVEFGDDVEVFRASSSSATVSRKGLEGGNRSKDAHARTASRRTNGDAVTVRSDRSVSMEPHDRYDDSRQNAITTLHNSQQHYQNQQHDPPDHLTTRLSHELTRMRTRYGVKLVEHDELRERLAIAEEELRMQEAQRRLAESERDEADQKCAILETVINGLRQKHLETEELFLSEEDALALSSGRSRSQSRHSRVPVQDEDWRDAVDVYERGEALPQSRNDISGFSRTRSLKVGHTHLLEPQPDGLSQVNSNSSIMPLSTSASKTSKAQRRQSAPVPQRGETSSHHFIPPAPYAPQLLEEVNEDEPIVSAQQGYEVAYMSDGSRQLVSRSHSTRSKASGRTHQLQIGPSSQQQILQHPYHNSSGSHDGGSSSAEATKRLKAQRRQSAPFSQQQMRTNTGAINHRHGLSVNVPSITIPALLPTPPLNVPSRTVSSNRTPPPSLSIQVPNNTRDESRAETDMTSHKSLRSVKANRRQSAPLPQTRPRRDRDDVRADLQAVGEDGEQSSSLTRTRTRPSGPRIVTGSVRRPRKVSTDKDTAEKSDRDFDDAQQQGPTPLLDFKFTSPEDILKVVRQLDGHLAHVAHTAVVLIAPPVSDQVVAAHKRRRGEDHVDLPGLSVLRTHADARLRDILGVKLHYELTARSYADGRPYSLAEFVERAIRAMFTQLLLISVDETLVTPWKSPTATTPNPARRPPASTPTPSSIDQDPLVADTITLINGILAISGLKSSNTHFEKYVHSRVNALWHTVTQIKEQLEVADPEMRRLYGLLSYGSYRTNIDTEGT